MRQGILHCCTFDEDGYCDECGAVLKITFDAPVNIPIEPPAQQHSATSRAAAKQIKERVPNLRHQVYLFIAQNGPCTDEAIANGLGLNPSTARPRRIELVAEGKVRAHWETQRTASGRQATAWVVT